MDHQNSSKAQFLNFQVTSDSTTDSYTFMCHLDCLTFLCSLFEAVINLLKHGLAASLKNRQHNALESIFIGCLDGPLHRFSCCSTNCISRVLENRKQLPWEQDNVMKSCVKKYRNNTGLTLHSVWTNMQTDGEESATYLGFDHLADIVLQGHLHSRQFSSNCVVQLTRHWLQTLRDC